MVHSVYKQGPDFEEIHLQSGISERSERLFNLLYIALDITDPFAHCLLARLVRTDWTWPLPYSISSFCLIFDSATTDKHST